MIVNPYILAKGSGGDIKTATGSYVGDGTYGEANPTVIEFPFVPVFAMIFFFYKDTSQCGPIWLTPETGMVQRVQSVGSGLAFSKATLSMEGNKASFYSTSNATEQANYLGERYVWIAFGFPTD